MGLEVHLWMGDWPGKDVDMGRITGDEVGRRIGEEVTEREERGIGMEIGDADG